MPFFEAFIRSVWLKKSTPLMSLIIHHGHDRLFSSLFCRSSKKDFNYSFTSAREPIKLACRSNSFLSSLHIPREQGSPEFAGSSLFFKKHGNSPNIPLFCSQFPCSLVPLNCICIPLFQNVPRGHDVPAMMPHNCFTINYLM